MVKLTLADAPEFELSTVDIDRPGSHFAVDTVGIIAAQNPTAELVYLMGGDSLPIAHLARSGRFCLPAIPSGYYVVRAMPSISPASKRSCRDSRPRSASWRSACFDIAAHDIREASPQAGLSAIICLRGYLNIFPNLACIHPNSAIVNISEAGG